MKIEQMERAISEYEESYKNTVNRINDIEWKIKQLQQYKNDKCECVVNLFEKSNTLKQNYNKLLIDSSEELDCDVKTKCITSLKNSIRCLEDQLSKLQNNIEDHQSNSNSECN